MAMIDQLGRELGAVTYGDEPDQCETEVTLKWGACKVVGYDARGQRVMADIEIGLITGGIITAFDQKIGRDD